MRRAAFAIVSTVAGLVLLLSFKTHSGTPAAAPPAAIGDNTGNGTTGTSGSGSTGTGTTGTGSTGTTGPGRGGAVSGTFTGDAADTRFGPVQVKVTLSSGKITAVEAVEFPQDSPRDQEINAYAIPALNQETMTAGSADIDTISGATYTSDGYRTSLQSALDQAGR